MVCAQCGHPVNEHIKWCHNYNCDCGCDFYSLAHDMRQGELRGYVEQFSSNTKIAILIGNSYHIFGIPEAEDFANFILACADVAKETAIPEDKEQT